MLHFTYFSISYAIPYSYCGLWLRNKLLSNIAITIDLFLFRSFHCEMVRITIVGREVAPVNCPEGCNADAVEKRLIAAYGPGLLKRGDDMVVTETLTGDYDFHITGNLLYFSLLTLSSSFHHPMK